jgi:4-carboxymuconolactone decarboxylase
MLKKFGEQGVMDLTGTVGYYTALAMVLNVARTPAAPSKMPLAPFPN